MHRFFWDLRYGRKSESATADDEDTGLQTWIGPLVLPGSYQVKLTVNGKSAGQQRFEVIMDPRSHATNAVLMDQLRWAQRAFEDMTTARVAAGEIRGLRIQLGKIKDGARNNTDLEDSLAAVDKQAEEIQSGGEKGRDSGLDAISRAFPIALNAFEGADRTPTAQAIALYQQSDRMLQSRMTEWKAMKQRTVPSLNRQLHGMGFSPVQIVRVEEEPQANFSQ
jgi:hypothetical protein